ncbi:hypothetical protein KC333_g8002 [Hortaea werneckii]|nr:hypothetical protein KC333_g8002 [Hortaea werneckii]KAI7306069.1 hypothetical protein KC326_g7992 [Hortaea werneckii]
MARNKKIEKTPRATILVLDKELFTLIAEACIRDGWFKADRIHKDVDTHYDGNWKARAPYKKDVANFSLTCKLIRSQTIGVLLKNIQVKTCLRTTRHGESGYGLAQKHLEMMLAPQSVILNPDYNGLIHSLCLEFDFKRHRDADKSSRGTLVDDQPGFMPPQFAKDVLRLIKSLKNLKVIKLNVEYWCRHSSFDPLQLHRNQSFALDPLRFECNEYLAAGGSFSDSIETLALGPECEYIIALCPRVTSITGYGRWMELPPIRSGTIIRDLFDAAAQAPKLTSFELKAWWSGGMLDQMLQRPRFKNITKLGMVGAITGTANSNGHEGFPDIEHPGNNILSRLGDFEDLQTIILPASVPVGLFKRAQYSRPSDDDLSEYFSGMIVSVHPAQEGPLPSDGIQGFEPDDWELTKWDNMYPWYETNKDASRQTPPDHQRLRSVFGEAYSHLAEIVGCRLPSLRTIWIDRLLFEIPEDYSEHDVRFHFFDLSEYTRLHLRDVRIRVAHTEDGARVDTVNGHPAITRTLLRTRAWEGDTNVPKYNTTFEAKKRKLKIKRS